MGWATAMAAVRNEGAPLVDDPARAAGVSALGLDETTLLHASATHRTEHVAGLVDLDTARLLDIARGRSGTVVGTSLGERSPQWRDDIDTVGRRRAARLCQRGPSPPP